jgi:flagellar motor switch protein FliN/FliY
MDFSGGGGGGAQPGGAGIGEQETENFRNLLVGTVESQKSNFSMLLSKSVTLKAPSAQVSNQSQFTGNMSGSMVQVDLDFSDGVTGRHLYLMNEQTALAIAGAMMGQDGVELDEAAMNALQEAFSQVSGPVITAIGDKAGETIMTATPEAKTVGTDNVSLPDGDFVALTYQFALEDGEQAEIYEIYDSGIVQNAVGQPAASQPQQQTQAAQAGGQEQDPFASLAGMAAQAGQQPQGGGGQAMQQGGAQGGGPSVQSVQFPNLQGGGGQQEQSNISLLMDVYMEMTVELGRTKKLIKEILGMGEGTIIELDKLAGEPVDILVNHKLIAKGEVVVIDENFGVRVTEIVSPMERVSNMT